MSMEILDCNQIDRGKRPEHNLDKYCRRVRILGLVGTTGSGFAYVAFQAQSSEMISLAGLDSSYSGTMISLFFIGFVLVSLFISQFGERLGQARLLLLGCILYGLGALVTAFAIKPFLLICGLILMGIAHGLVLPGFSNIIMLATSPEKHVRYSSFAQVFLCFSSFLTPLLIVMGVAVKRFFIFVFVYHTVLTIITFLVIRRSYDLLRLWGTQTTVTEKPKKNASSFQLLVCLRKFEFTLLALAIALYAAVEISVSFYAGSYISDLGGSRELASLSLSLFWIGLLAGLLFASVSSVRLSQLTLAVAPIGIIITMSLMLIVPEPILVCAMTTLSGFFCGPLWPMFLSLGRGLFLDIPTAATSMMALANGLGGIVFPPLLSLPNKPAQILTLSLIPALLLALICLYLYFKRRQMLFHTAMINDS